MTVATPDKKSCFFDIIVLPNTVVTTDKLKMTYYNISLLLVCLYFVMFFGKSYTDFVAFLPFHGIISLLTSYGAIYGNWYHHGGRGRLDAHR